jgi:catechol 2,3-dioxygenase-like lactoylglutathione lyase family enzyme
MLTCASVTKSSEWYQRVLGLRSVHGGDEYDQLTAGEEHDPVILQLHRRDPHEHAHLAADDRPIDGNGVAVWFETDRFDAVAERLHASDATIVEDVHVNPLANHLEVWLRDLDGYLVVVSSPYGDVG